ncbi:LLM class flavin-dependent oxidoreductase [Marinobacter sp. M216]|uniref:LLM class flavin-dependent oxidoreductase n=1 Tax=Marinobacter albus TaxID=3030833 RepID=A0ABT7HGU0_9GAMM|nr:MULTISPECIES: LLM class flavin-dependent oxidoreductase [unclassified Marinobacter]MBW7472130.1 LLM class flavin-dependent oxidoreductase [Marinobacter sp. F4218]MDK9558700.1 LLM class flavin-dependent oxidoreductase [Marinobacter sp. M216]
MPNRPDYSLLELASVREGDSVSTTLANSVAYAQHAEQLGYRRFWLAEHHNMEGISSSATSVLIGHIAGKTNRIRVGSGGVMLPNHPPLVIAEQFGTLESLYPGRIDLGLGRAPGTDPITARALRREGLGAEQFPEDVARLQQLLGPLQPDQPVKAIPGAGTRVPVWLLGSSLYSAQLAAMRGLPYAFAGHFAPRLYREALRVYRDNFQPSEQLSSPYAMLAVPAIPADSMDEAKLLATTSYQRILALFRGQPLWMRPPVESMEGLWNAGEKASVQDFLTLQLLGNADDLNRQLDELLGTIEVDELMFTIDIYDPAKRRHALDVLAQTQRS